MRKVRFTQSGVLGDLWFAQFEEKEVSEEQYRTLLAKGWIFGERPETAAHSGSKSSKSGEWTAFFSDRRLTLADLDSVPQSQRVSVVSRGSLPQAMNVQSLPFSAFRLRVSCREAVRIKQWFFAMGLSATLWLNGKAVDTFAGEKMGLNLLHHPNTGFVRNTTRLNLEHLENGSLKIVPLVENAFVGVATIAAQRTMRVEKDQVYTVSFEYQGDTDNMDYCYLVSKTKGNFHFGKHSVEAAIDEPSIFSYTFAAPWDADDVGLLIGFHNTKNQAVVIDKVRFEVGTKRRQSKRERQLGNDGQITEVDTPFFTPIETEWLLPQGESELVWLLNGENATLQTWGDFIDGESVQAA